MEPEPTIAVDTMDTDDPMEAHVAMFKAPEDKKLVGKQIVKQANGLVKLARLAYHGDFHASLCFVPIWPWHVDGVDLPEVMEMPVWLHRVADKRFGKFDFLNGPFVKFKWRDFFAEFEHSSQVWRGTLVNPHFAGGPVSCRIESDGRPAAQPWVYGPGFVFKFKGVLGWRLPRMILT